MRWANRPMDVISADMEITVSSLRHPTAWPTGRARGLRSRQSGRSTLASDRRLRISIGFGLSHSIAGYAAADWLFKR
jgi:hypothetical protein